MTEREYVALLYSFSFFGPVRTKLLLKYFKSASEAWKAPLIEFRKLGFSPKVISSFSAHKKSLNSSKYFSELDRRSIKFVTINEKDYPKNLKGIINAPTVLYYIGNLTGDLSNAVAVVGSRKMSSYGREVAEKISGELSAMGVVIVSGLALGIDAVAHRACINTKGKGIVVLASGLDTISPYTNQWIAKEIVKLGGLIVSEFPLGQPPFRTSFPSRNRIISGLSKAVIIIEGLEKSGTLLTASAAAEQGRTVFAVPGQITSPLTFAPHYLIQNGAKLLMSVNDVLEELDLDFKVDHAAINAIMPEDNFEENVLKFLNGNELHIDELSRLSGNTINGLASKLTLMELKGLVKSLGGGIYRKR